MKRTIIFFFAGIAVGIGIGAAIFPCKLESSFSGISEQPRRTTIKVPWLTQELVKSELIHPLIGKPYSTIESTLLKPDAEASDDSIEVDSGVLNEGRMEVHCGRLIAVKTDAPRNLVIFGFDDFDHCLGYWQIPAN